MNLSNTIILLNAPKNAGKDVVAEHLSNLTGASVVRFKEHLYHCVSVLFKVPVMRFKELATDRATKEVPNERFEICMSEYDKVCEAKSEPNYMREGGYAGNVLLSPREALIYVSECIIKPHLGKDYFGKIVANEINMDVGAVSSDSGFLEELIPLASRHGMKNVFVVQFSREGCSFGGDSRGYMDVPSGIPCTFLKNDGTIDEFCKKVLDWVENERFIQEEVKCAKLLQ